MWPTASSWLGAACDDANSTRPHCTVPDLGVRRRSPLTLAGPTRGRGRKLPGGLPLLLRAGNGLAPDGAFPR